MLKIRIFIIFLKISQTVDKTERESGNLREIDQNHVAMYAKTKKLIAEWTKLFGSNSKVCGIIKK